MKQSGKNNDEIKKTVKEEPEIVAGEIETVSTDVERYPLVRRMLQSLDKFLSQRFLSVIGIYLFGLAACSTVVLVKGIADASSGSDGPWGFSTLEVWMYSLAVTMTLVFILATIRFIAIKRRHKKVKP